MALDTPSGPWLGLLIGNTRLHWARFSGDALVAHWQQPHSSPSQSPHRLSPRDESIHATDNTTSDLADRRRQAMMTIPPAHRCLLEARRLWLASVVPQQTQYWQPYCHHIVTLAHIPLENTYPTFGVDRALALWGAGQRWHFPVLVVDGGTALTYTGANAERALVGGAILPGLQLQLRSLHHSAALLPSLDLTVALAEASDTAFLPRWATTTEAAILSGTLYSTIAGVESFLRDWWQRYPNSSVVFTGGDGKLLHQRLPTPLRLRTDYDPHLGLWGLQQVRRRLIAAS